MNNLQDNPTVSSVESPIFPVLSGPSGPSRYSTGNYQRFNNIDISENELVLKSELVKSTSISPLKWKLQNIAKSILDCPPRYLTFDKSEKAVYIPDKWTNFRKCYKIPISKTIDIVHSAKSHKSHFLNLSTCGSVWVCPVCSLYVASQRCLELTEGIKKHLSKSPENSVLLMSLTVAHSRFDILSEMNNKLKKAKDYFFGHWSVRNEFKKIGYVGRVTCFDITYSNLNGWHPHDHILMFLNSPVDMKKLKDFLYPFWFEALYREGLTCSEEKGMNIQGGNLASEYVTGLAQEMTLSCSKLGNITGSDNIPHYTPFQLLDYIHLNGEKRSVAWAKNAFYEYAETMRGRKQIVYSRGLKDYLGIRDISDEQAAQPHDDDLKNYVSISSYDWYKKIIRHSGVDLRAEILRQADISRENLISYLKSLDISYDEDVYQSNRDVFIGPVDRPEYRKFKDNFSQKE